MDTPEQKAFHGDVDHGLGGIEAGFVITHEAAPWVVNHAGLPERASSHSPSKRCSTNRQRHLLTVASAMLHVTTGMGKDERADRMVHLLGDPTRQIVFFKSEDQASLSPGLQYDRASHPDAYFMAISLDDDSWLVFTALTRFRGITSGERMATIAVMLMLTTVLVSAITAKQLAAPVKRFADAARRFGLAPKAAPLAETGPIEFRIAINAFNAMQGQIARFVSDRTEMLAAISHDLRTPLTRMRLRGEFVEDPEQQCRLFQDVDEMQMMVDEALAFFKDNAANEQSTQIRPCRTAAYHHRRFRRSGARRGVRRSRSPALCRQTHCLEARLHQPDRQRGALCALAVGRA
jgi:signal transduction histidine kinase